MLVTILVFSGRRNPEWELSAKQVKAFIKLWNAAKEETTPQEMYSKLGYQGFHVVNDKEYWEVYNGLIKYAHGTLREQRLDDENAMEKFLRSTVPDETDAMLKQMGL